MKQHVDVVILGGGPAGIAAAIWCKRLNITHILIEQKNSLGGQLPSIHNEIIDYPGVIAKDGTVLQKYLIQHLHQTQCNYMTNTTVRGLDVANQSIEVQHEHEHITFSYRYLIMATGSSPRRLHVPGEQELYDRNEVFSATRDRELFQDKKVVVIGGGDRAFEGAFLLAKSGAHVTLLHRSDTFRARHEYKQPVLNHKQIEIHPFTIVKEIIGKEKVTAVVYTDRNNQRYTVDTSAVFIRIGAAPNINLIKSYVSINQDGSVNTNQYFQTSQPTIYAIGDICTEPLYSSISTATAHGMIAVKHISTLLH
ncbi:NAD(P)/FAD-dependent oxidoreductase [Priestia megaterium]|nr:NAD(P)/FAD-dependent oxidoreductase [Priestia megaterium]